MELLGEQHNCAPFHSNDRVLADHRENHAKTDLQKLDRLPSAMKGQGVNRKFELKQEALKDVALVEKGQKLVDSE